VFETDGDDPLAQFGADPAPCLRRGFRAHAADAAARTRQQQLRHLLRDRRSPLDDAMAADVARGGAHDRDRIDAGMPPEAPILSRNRGVDQRRRQLIGREPRGAAAVACARLV
jgi:hypothetical protein